MIPKALGVCIKFSDGRVQSQDRKCQELCGDKLGKICTEGCMQRGEFDEGLFFLSNVQTPGGLTDAVVLKDGKQLTTLLYPKRQSIQTKLNELKPFRLSPTETRVMKLFYEGRSRKEICKSLFISLPTLKTHINNILERFRRNSNEKFCARVRVLSQKGLSHFRPDEIMVENLGGQHAFSLFGSGCKS